jgi:hypothetical protein
VRVDVVASDARGVALLVGAVEPVADGFRVAWEWPERRTASSSTIPYPFLHEGIPARATTLAIRAEGCAPHSLALDPQAPNPGLPRILQLRKE